MKSGRFILLGAICVLIIIACAQEGVKKPTLPTKERPQVAELYLKKPKPLTPIQCGQCHMSLYMLVRKEGGRHQIECTKCHTQYHVYNPIKQNWSEIMPKCQRCHGLFHGETLPKCMECHIEPHAPKKIPMSTVLEDNCLTCHGKVGDEMKQYPSLHKQQACSLCHERHGYIPSCMDCHEPHTTSLTKNEQCLACHPVHSPTRRLKYAKETPNEICASCHDDIATTLAKNKSKHHDVACVACHNKHKYVPKCEECHKEPHSKQLLKKFKNCLQCHIDPHNLPAKTVVK